MLETKREISKLDKARFELRSVLGQYPFYTSYLRHKLRMVGLDAAPGWNVCLVDKYSELVIDAFWRSGNTFALAALKLTMGPDFQVGHHACTPSQVKMAKKLAIPTLLIIRPPRDTVISCLKWNPYSPNQWLRTYIRYYEGIADAADWACVAEFGELISDFGVVLERLNQRFGTNIGPFDHSDDNVRRCFEMIEQNDRLRFGTVAEAQVSRPSDERALGRASLEKFYEETTAPHLRKRAGDAFDEISKFLR